MKSVEMVFTTALVGLVIWAPPARADIFVSAATGCWNKESTWLQNNAPARRIPDLAHRDVVILQDYDVFIDDKNSAMTLHVHPNRMLWINDGKRLLIDGSAQIDGMLLVDGGTFQVDRGSATITDGGAIVMSGDGPVLRTNSPDGIVLGTGASTIMVCSDATISGTGSVRGDNPSASILINCDVLDSVTLTLDDATLHGSFMVVKGYGDGSARFHNDGLVQADAIGSVLVLDNSLDSVTDTRSNCQHPRWRADGTPGYAAALAFDQDAVELQGDFKVSGILKIEASSVATTGSLRLENCGRVHPSGNGVFSADGECPGSACVIPSPVIIPVTCTCR